MMIQHEKIADGQLDGEIVWVCDYRHDDIAHKAIRHVPPQAVLVRPNLETSQRIYYSESHFAPLNAKGQPLAKVIALFDNTGYRSISGTPVQVFDNEAECRSAYVQACHELIARNMCYRDQVEDQVSARIKELDAKIKQQNGG